MDQPKRVWLMKILLQVIKDLLQQVIAIKLWKVSVVGKVSVAASVFSRAI